MHHRAKRPHRGKDHILTERVDWKKSNSYKMNSSGILFFLWSAQGAKNDDNSINAVHRKFVAKEILS